MCSKRKSSENAHAQSRAKRVQLHHKRSGCPTDGLPLDGPISEHSMNSLPNSRTVLSDADADVEQIASEQEADCDEFSAERHTDIQPSELRSPTPRSASACDRDGPSTPLISDEEHSPLHQEFSEQFPGSGVHAFQEQEFHEPANLLPNRQRHIDTGSLRILSDLSGEEQHTTAIMQGLGETLEPRWSSVRLYNFDTDVWPNEVAGPLVFNDFDNVWEQCAPEPQFVNFDEIWSNDETGTSWFNRFEEIWPNDTIQSIPNSQL